MLMVVLRHILTNGTGRDQYSPTFLQRHQYLSKTYIRTQTLSLTYVTPILLRLTRFRAAGAIAFPGPADNPTPRVLSRCVVVVQVEDTACGDRVEPGIAGVGVGAAGVLTGLGG